LDAGRTEVQLRVELGTWWALAVIGYPPRLIKGRFAGGQRRLI
jgi:hypothetical protein